MTPTDAAISVGAYSIRYVNVGSMEEMVRTLDLCELGSIVLDAPCSMPSAFGAVLFDDGRPSGCAYGAGLTWDGNGYGLILLPRPEVGDVVFGFHRLLAAVQIGSKAPTFKTVVPGFVRQLFRSDFKDVAVLYEFGISRFDANGSEVWDQSFDLITEWHLSGTAITLRFVDGQSAEIDLRTGWAPSGVDAG